MKKYLFLFLLISVIVGFPVILYNYWRSDLELIFTLDPDNYDILEFIFWNSGVIYVVLFIVSLLFVNFCLLKNYFYKFFSKTEIYQPTNFTNRFYIRSPPFAD